MGTNQSIKFSKEPVCLAVDMETLGRASDAIVISLAAVPFFRDGSVPPDVCPFYEAVNVLSCAFKGMSIDEDTMRWWQERDSEVRNELIEKKDLPIEDVMDMFVLYVNQLQAVADTDVQIWVQGTDFDLPILRNALCLCDRKEDIPWKYNMVRDARTFINETMDIVRTIKGVDLSESLPKNERPHSALEDCHCMVARIQYLWEMCNDLFSGPNEIG